MTQITPEVPLRKSVRDVSINLDIPGYIKEAELRFLGAFVRGLPDKSVLLDIGCGWGREAWVFSKNAPPSSSIYCVDIWGWPPTWKYIFLGNRTLEETGEKNLKNSEEEFRSYVRDCPNIIPVKGDRKCDWDGPSADFIFYDEEDEEEEIILPKLRHWLGRLKPGGVLAGTDFYPYSQPPVKSGLVAAVRRCARENNLLFLHNTGTSIWMMMDPATFISWHGDKRGF